MTKIEKVVYKYTRSADGSTFAESVELGVDCADGADVLPPEEIQKFDDLSEQMRNIVREKVSEWPIEKKRMTSPKPVGPPKEYDAATRSWSACPTCGHRGITFASQRGGDYQKCPKCRIYLNEDGTTKVMGPRPMGVARPLHTSASEYAVDYDPNQE